MPFRAETVGNAILELHASPFELILGRRTYDIWADYWPSVTGNAIGDAFNNTVKHVATHRPDSLSWKGSQAIEGALGPAVRDLKSQSDVDLLTWGSSEVVRQLLAAGLIDTIWLFVYPVVLGRGKRLFDENTMPSTFNVAQSETSTTGIQVLQLERAGDVRTGSYT